MRFLERAARRLLLLLDAAANRVYGAAWNPLFQSGTVAVAMLVALIVTGLYLIVFYRVGSPAASVARLASDPWIGAWMRGLHRYASDVFLVAGALHLVRMFAQRRSWGPRTLAWVSGLLLFGTGVACAWTGFVMAWDTFGERLAREGARMLDILPIFSEPLGRIFAGDRPVPSAFFFVNLFVHIGVPLAMGALLWLHVSRVARPVLLPPRRVTWTIVVVLAAAAVLAPPALGPAADALLAPPDTPVDLVAAWWLPISESMGAGTVWGVGFAVTVAVLFVPRWTRRDRTDVYAPSTVDPRLCTGCNQCPQDCPWEAITMVPREDDRPTLLAQVDPARCVSCGICAGSCAPMGVGPPGRSGRDQLAVVRAEISRALDSAPRPSIVAVCCAQAPASHVAALRQRGAIIHTVPCAGNLHSSVIELILRGGASGVLVSSCAPRDCASREGPKWLHERLYHDREAELQARVDRRRVRVTLAAGMRAHSITALEDFRTEVAALALPLQDDHALELICEPTAVSADERDR